MTGHDIGLMPSLIRAFGPTLLVGILVTASCARSLRQDTDLVKGPEDMKQKIETLDTTVEKVVRPPAPAPVQTPVVPQKKGSTRQKKSKAIKEAAKPAPTPAAPAIPTWTPQQWPFSVGEKITFVLRYGVLEGGIATLEVKEPKKLDGEPVLHFFARVKSSRVLELFYKVDDDMQSWVGLHDFLPRRQEIHQNESSRSGVRVVVFDSAAHVAKYYAKAQFPDGRVEEIRREDPAPNFAQDIFGALYFYRFVTRDGVINFPIHDRWRNWNNELQFLGFEDIRVPAGEFHTRHYKMLPRVTGYLEPKGDVEIWVRDDPSRVIVQFKAKIKVGSLTGELKEYVPGTGWDLPLPSIRTPTELNEMGEFKAR